MYLYRPAASWSLWMFLQKVLREHVKGLSVRNLQGLSLLLRFYPYPASGQNCLLAAFCPGQSDISGVAIQHDVRQKLSVLLMKLLCSSRFHNHNVWAHLISLRHNKFFQGLPNMARTFKMVT